MRITEGMIFDQGMAGIQAARAREELAVAQTSSGARVVLPGDDPGAAGQIVLHRLTAGRIKGIQQAVGRASDELGSADSALDNLSNIVANAQQLAVQLSNGTYSANERTGGASQVQGLLQEAVGLLNTQVGNRYIFGGNRDGTPPFDVTGAYSGDAGVRQVEIAPGVLQNASVRADMMIKGVGGGVDVLGTLQTLQAALTANDPAAVSATLGALATSVNQIALARAQVGSAMNVFASAGQAASTAATAETATISGLADADAINSASELAQSQTALDAALTATAKSFSLSLVDKLG
jgi:flagellar hook-associated protein 3 FlgL